MTLTQSNAAPLSTSDTNEALCDMKGVIAMRKLALWCGAILLGVLGACVQPTFAARAFDGSGCTTVTMDGQSYTAKVVNPPLMSGTVFAQGCDIGIYIGPGHSAELRQVVVLNATLADVAVDQGSAKLIQTTLSGSYVGLYFRYATVSLAYSTAVNNSLGIYGTGSTLTMVANNIFSNYVGSYTRHTRVTASYDAVHENSYFGYLFDVGHVMVDHERIYGNNGFGLFSFYANVTLSDSFVFANSYGYTCNDNVFSCSVIAFGNESRTFRFKFGHQYAVESFGRTVTLNHTRVDNNYAGVMASQSSGVVLVTNYSLVCNNHPNHNVSAGNGGTVSSLNSTICFP